MTPDPQRRELLADLLQDTSAAGPSLDSVMDLVRAERNRRAHQRHAAMVVATLAVLVTAGVLWLRPQASRLPAQAALSAPTAAEMFPVKKVNDEELFQLLADQPLALVKLPNGERQLLLVTQSGGEGE
jgi:hypothetical protein